jgi:hypothetical protein
MSSMALSGRRLHFGPAQHQFGRSNEFLVGTAEAAFVRESTHGRGEPSGASRLPEADRGERRTEHRDVGASVSRPGGRRAANSSWAILGL